MEIEKLIIEFNSTIDSLLQRVQINNIVGTSHDIHTKGWHFNDVEEYFKENPFHRIIINQAIYLNDLNKDHLQSQSAEDKDLVTTFSLFHSFIDKEINRLVGDGIFLYEINELIRNTIQKIDNCISSMNADLWFAEKKAKIEENVFYLLIGKQRRTYTEFRFDFGTYCKNDIDNNFIFRSMLLYDLKYKLINIYSQFLILPHHSTLPKIKFNCAISDICGLIQALHHSTFIEDSDKFKAILLKMFDLDSVKFSKYIHEFREKKTISPFLSEIINSLQPSEVFEKVVKNKKARTK